MNVIISKDKSVRFTQESSSAYNLQDISFYISKEIVFTAVKLILQKDELFNKYEFNLIEKPNLSVNYHVYTVDLSQSINLSAGTYLKSAIMLDTETVELPELPLSAILLSHSGAASIISDKHEPIVIRDRDIIISGNQNTIVAEDNVSQEIRFKLSRYYDSVDLADKEFYFDYLMTDDYGDQELFNEPLVKIAPTDDTPETEDDVVIVSLVVPYRITKKAGNLPFAISAIDEGTDANGNQYVWQTKPSSLIIQKNLFKRNETPKTSSETTGFEELMANIEALEATNEEQTTALNNLADTVEEQGSQITENANSITTIMNSDIYNADTNDAENEVVIGGGGADSVKEG